MPRGQGGCNWLGESCEGELDVSSWNRFRLRNRRKWTRPPIVAIHASQKVSSGDCGRGHKKKRFCDMHSHRDAHLPVPAALLRLARALYAIWTAILTKTRETWDWSLIWLYAHYAAYRSTEEDRAQLLEWVRSKAPGSSVSDFSNTWSNGVALVALLEGLLPAACSTYTQYHLLNPKHSVQNVELGFSVAQKYIGLRPNMKAAEVVAASSPASERKLICYITMIRLAMTLPKMLAILAQPADSCPKEDPVFRNQPCLAKGMGLILAVKGRCARFNIYLKHSDFLDIVIEIRGPNGNFCSRRITLRSPHKIVNRAAPFLPPISAASSPDQPQGSLSPTMTIPLEYEITGRKVSVMYIPRSTGKHILNVFWHGQHLKGSPYTVTVDDSFDKFPEATVTKQAASINAIDSNLLRLMPTRMCPSLLSGPRKVGRIICRRVIRRVVLRNGEELELRDGEPLPLDVRTWCSSKNIFDNPSDVDSSPPHQETKPITLRRSRTLIKQDSMDLGLDLPCDGKSKNITASTVEESRMNSRSIETILKNDEIDCFKDVLSESTASPCKSPVIPVAKFVLLGKLNELHVQQQEQSDKELQEKDCKQLPNEEMAVMDRKSNYQQKDEVDFTASNNTSCTDCSRENYNPTNIWVDELPHVTTTLNWDSSRSGKLHNLTVEFPERNKGTSHKIPSADTYSDVIHVHSPEDPVPEAEESSSAGTNDYDCKSATDFMEDVQQLENLSDLSNITNTRESSTTTTLVKYPKFGHPAEVLRQLNDLSNGNVSDGEDTNNFHNLHYADEQCSSVDRCDYGTETELEGTHVVGCYNGSHGIVDKHYEENNVNNDTNVLDGSHISITEASLNQLHKSPLIYCPEGTCDSGNQVVHHQDVSLQSNTRSDESNVIGLEKLVEDSYDFPCLNRSCNNTVKFGCQVDEMSPNKPIQSLQDCNKNTDVSSDHHTLIHENCQHMQLIAFPDKKLHTGDESNVFDKEDCVIKIQTHSNQQQPAASLIHVCQKEMSEIEQQFTATFVDEHDYACLAAAVKLPTNFQIDFVQNSPNGNPEQLVGTSEILEYQQSLKKTFLNQSLPESSIKCFEEPGILATERLTSCSSNCSLQKNYKDCTDMSNLTSQETRSCLSILSDDQPFNAVRRLDYELRSEEDLEISRRERSADFDAEPVVDLCWENMPVWSGSDMSLVSTHSSFSVPLDTTDMESPNMALNPMPFPDGENESVSLSSICYDTSTDSSMLEPPTSVTTATQTSFVYDSPFYVPVSSSSYSSRLSLVLSPTYLDECVEGTSEASSDNQKFVSASPTATDYEELHSPSLGSVLTCDQNDIDNQLATTVCNAYPTTQFLNQEACKQSLPDPNHVKLPIKSLVRGRIQEWEFCVMNGQARERSFSCPASLQITPVQDKLALFQQNMSFSEQQPAKNDANESTIIEELGQLKVCASRISQFESGQLPIPSGQSTNNALTEQTLPSENLSRPTEAAPLNTGSTTSL